MRFFVVMMPVGLMVVSVNYVGDAANLFSVNYEHKIAAELVKGNHVTNVYNYNERILQKILVNARHDCPEIEVLGSSRIMFVSSNHFTENTFFNYAVSGATVEDLISIVYLNAKKKCFPKRVILGLDPWMLNSNNGLEKWRTLSEEYELFLDSAKLSRPKGLISKIKLFYVHNLRYKELISPSYFKSSFLNLISKKGHSTVTQVRVNKYFTKLSDGSICYGEEIRNASDAKINEWISTFISEGQYGIENFDSLNASLQKKLVQLIDYLQAHGVQIDLFLVPYHPKVYKVILNESKYHKVLECEIYFHQLARDKGIRLIGSFNPAELNFSNHSFYDAMHLKEEEISSMLKLLSPPILCRIDK